MSTIEPIVILGNQVSIGEGQEFQPFNWISQRNSAKPMAGDTLRLGRGGAVYRIAGLVINRHDGAFSAVANWVDSAFHEKIEEPDPHSWRNAPTVEAIMEQLVLRGWKLHLYQDERGGAVAEATRPNILPSGRQLGLHGYEGIGLTPGNALVDLLRKMPA